MDYPQIILREEQTVNENTHVHLLAGGRGSGKTAAGARFIATDPVHSLVIAPDMTGARDTIAEGESGLMVAARSMGADFFSVPREEPHFANTYRYGGTDTRVHVTSLDRLIPVIGALNEHVKEPVERIWIDEAQKMKLRDWKILHEAFPDAQYLLTFTPTPNKNKLLTYLYRRAGAFRPKYVLYTMSSFDNAQNLDKRFVEHILGTYAKTDMAKSELHGEYRRVYYA